MVVMGTVKPKRKRKYQKDPFILVKAMAMNEAFSDDELRTMALPVRISFNLLLNGEAEDIDVMRLIDNMNVALVRSWGTPMQPIAETAVHALRRCYERWQKLGKWGLDGPARADIEQGIELHEELCRLSTPRQMQEAAAAVEKIRNEHRAK